MAAVYTTICSQVGSKCAGYDSTTHNTSNPYVCQGHTGVRPGNSIAYENYKEGDIVEAKDINAIYNGLSVEYEARKKHIIYKNLDGEFKTVNAGDTIDDIQQLKLGDLVAKLNLMVNSNAKFGDTILGVKDKTYKPVKAGDIVDDENLKHIEPKISDTAELTATVQDCICYSDCSNYYAYQQLVCSCVCQCGCVYG